jgi:hypothetical protein
MFGEYELIPEILRFIWFCFAILVGKSEGRNHLEDPGVDGRIILKWIVKKWDGGMDWIYRHQNRDRWRALMDAAKNIRVP